MIKARPCQVYAASPSCDNNFILFYNRKARQEEKINLLFKASCCFRYFFFFISLPFVNIFILKPRNKKITKMTKKNSNSFL